MPDEETDLFYVIHHCRAMRRLRPDPVPDPILMQLLDAANQGPTGSNKQNARWIVVRDPEQRKQLADLNRAAVKAYIGPQSGRPAALPHQTSEKRQRMLEAVLWQAEHMHEIPALVIACYEFDQPVSGGSAAMAGGSIWPAVQNLLLAARAHGLGANVTVWHLFREKDVRRVLGVPSDVGIYALIPIGWPLGNFGPVRRQALDEVIHWDRRCAGHRVMTRSVRPSPPGSRAGARLSWKGPRRTSAPRPY